MKREAPLYDRSRLVALVTAHKKRVQRMGKKTGTGRRYTTGVKAPR